MKIRPGLKFESKLWKKNFLVCGIDEVGRGAFAGPLTIGGVILKPIDHSDHSAIRTILSLGINDSKLVSPRKRKLIAESVQQYILYQSIQYISVKKINAIGVGRANKLGFQMIANDLNNKVGNKDIFFLTDAFTIPNVEIRQQKNIIHGDQISISIAVASILAKVSRDTYMMGLGEKFPNYGLDRNKGYGTPFHRESIKKYGSCPHHRVAFIH